MLFVGEIKSVICLRLEEEGTDYWRKWPLESFHTNISARSADTRESTPIFTLTIGIRVKVEDEN